MSHNPNLHNILYSRCRFLCNLVGSLYILPYNHLHCNLYSLLISIGAKRGYFLFQLWPWWSEGRMEYMCDIGYIGERADITFCAEGNVVI